MRRRTDSGFTLIELTIVVVVIAILAGMTVPNFLASRLQANERAALASMRAIVNAEFQARSQLLVDSNGDGVGEFAFLGELAGQRTVRGSGNRISPPVLSVAMGMVDNTGTIIRGGYLFRVFLPNAAGVGVPETVAGIASVDPTMAADHWAAMAWPAGYGQSGLHTLWTGSRGEILKTKATAYSGALATIYPSAPFITAAPLGLITGTTLAINVTASDGNVWRVVP
jgi:prepilin-type N-terminal cleavage/methylation domain-containing protein